MDSVTQPVAIVPLKAGPHAKVRLAGILSPSERSGLAERLAATVCGALIRAGLRTVLVADRDTGVVEGAELLVLPGVGLNAAVRAATSRFGMPALVVPADLPWLAAPDVLRLLGEPGDVVVVPTLDGGTGALLMRRPVEPRFGPRSALEHAAVARASGARTRVVRIDGFARDLDDEASLRLARPVLMEPAAAPLL